MLTTSLKSLLAHKRRLIGTALAVFLGVAFLTGTLVLSDTIRGNFDTLFASANAGTDAVVRNAAAVEADGGRGPSARARGLVPASIVDTLREVDGVAAVAPQVQGYGQLIGKDGKAIGGNGPPRVAANWVEDPDLTAYRLVEGRAPQADDEVVVNRGAASDGDLRIGDTATVQTPEPVRVRIVGIATWGSADGFGRSTYTGFTLSGAQRYVLNKPGQLSSIAVQAAPGMSQQQLVDRIRPVLPRGVEALTGAQLTDETIADVSGQFLNMFETFLLVFAGVALLVATFSIHNTFTIVVAQRTRESALLRALGAARSQVLGSVLAEAAAVGLLASAAGLAGGLGIAALLKAVFTGFGFALPASGLVLTGTTVAVSLLVGLVVTVLAGVVPAVKASRVPPLAAMRSVAVDRTGASASRVVAGGALLAAGVLTVLTAVTGGGESVLVRAGVGAALTLLGVVVFGPVVARLASRLIGAPLPRLRGITGSLARENAMRNPRRTSGTAAALLVGVGVVTLFTVFAASLKASLDRSVATSFGGDLAVTGNSFGTAGFSPRLAADVARLPEVRVATGLAQAPVTVDGGGTEISAADPKRIAEVLDLDVRQGSVADLASTQLAVSTKVAGDKGWTVGSQVPVRYADGTSLRLTVGAVYQATGVVGDYLLPRAAWAPHTVQDADTMVFVALRPGVELAAGRAAVERAVAAYGGPTVRDRDEFAASFSQGVDTMLAIVYVLLALAILIALLGITNTLSLSVHERTRELGLLRAVGQTRAQLRAMVRWESVIVALFGTVGGLGLGVFLGWALVRASSTEDIGAFAAPVGRLVAVLVAGAFAGVLAGVRPARRAARLDMLAAIATE
jgi:putative ABC transport system permease protein